MPAGNGLSNLRSYALVTSLQTALSLTPARSLPPLRSHKISRKFKTTNLGCSKERPPYTLNQDNKFESFIRPKDKYRSVDLSQTNSRSQYHQSASTQSVDLTSPRLHVLDNFKEISRLMTQSFNEQKKEERRLGKTPFEMRAMRK